MLSRKGVHGPVKTQKVPHVVHGRDPRVTCARVCASIGACLERNVHTIPGPAEPGGESQHHPNKLLPAASKGARSPRCCACLEAVPPQFPELA